MPASLANVAPPPDFFSVMAVAYSGPIPLGELETNSALGDEDGGSPGEDWPPLPQPCPPNPAAAAVGNPELPPPLGAPSPMKHPADCRSGGDRGPSPTADTAVEQGPLPLQPTAHCQSTAAPSHAPPSLHARSAPAFAPRSDYVKLMFRDSPGVDVKLRWLSEVTKAFSLDRELAEVKMSAITSRFVYISRRRQDVLDNVKNGEFLSLHLDTQDMSERPRKFPTYLMTRFPIGIDPSLAKELPGVYAARRFIQDGNPINRLVITWSLPEPPPPTVMFSFLPCLPPCELHRMKDVQPWCFKCWGIGHISRYCSASDKCAFCAAKHATRSCPYRPSVVSAVDEPSTSTSLPSSPPVPDTSQWMCPRCHEPGVNVWH